MSNCPGEQLSGEQLSGEQVSGEQLSGSNCPVSNCPVSNCPRTRATKLIPEHKDKPYKDRLKALQLPSLTYRRKRGDMIQMYKSMHELVRIDPEKLFTQAKAAYTRGHNQRVFKTHAKKNARQFCLSQRIVNNWNGLSQHVLSASTINEFKNRLDKF